MEQNTVFTDTAGTRHLYMLCDGNKSVGYGHFYRCFHLRNALKAELENAQSHREHFSKNQRLHLNISWFGALDDSLLKLIGEDDYHPHSSCAEASAKLLSMPPTTLISDSYLLSENDIEQLAQQHKLIAIDDFARHPHKHAKAVLNFCVSASGFYYESKQQLLGPKYFLNDPRLDSVRSCKLIKSSHAIDASKSTSANMHILIAMGGFDRFLLGEKIALALQEAFPDMSVTLLGEAAGHLPLKIRHIQRTQDMASLYQQSDVVICGGGLIKYESAYCATPSIAVSQTPEQHAESEAFAAKELCLSYGLAQDWHEQEFLRWFKSIDLALIVDQIKTTSEKRFVSKSTQSAAIALLDLI